MVGLTLQKFSGDAQLDAERPHVSAGKPDWAAGRRKQVGEGEGGELMNTPTVARKATTKLLVGVKPHCNLHLNL